MHIGFLNPQGNFDPLDSHLTQHPDFGGQLVYVKELAIQLGRLGHKVDILTRRFTDSSWPEYSDPTDVWPGEENVRILRLDCGPEEFVEKERLWPYLDEWVAKVREYYQEEGSSPDIFTAHYADGGLAAVLLQESEKTPFTFTGHSLGSMKMERLISDDDEFYTLVERYRFDYRIAAERCSFSHAAAIVTSSDVERREHLGHNVYSGSVDVEDDSKFSLIPPGVNPDIFGTDIVSDDEDKIITIIEETIHRDIPAARRHLPMVICSSRLAPKKNIIGLVRAWAESETLMASANLIISLNRNPYPFYASEGSFTPREKIIFDKIRALIDERNLWPCVMSLSLATQADLAAAYRHLGRAHRGVFALTAFHEPFGLSPLEAMACGLPAVVTQNGGPAESLQDGAGVLVDPYDPDDIASGLLKLVQREDCWKQYRDAGTKRVREVYTWERTARSYESLFNRVLKEKNAVETSGICPEWLSDLNSSENSVDWLKSLWNH